MLLYAFPPLCLILPTLARVREQGPTWILIAPRWPKAPYLGETIPLLYAQPLVLAVTHSPTISGEWGDSPFPAGQGGTLGLQSLTKVLSLIHFVEITANNLTFNESIGFRNGSYES